MKPLHTWDLVALIREEQPKRRDNGSQDYCEIRLEKSSRDCDGPMYYKPDELLITEEEITLVLGDHFGPGGWTLEDSKPDDYPIWHCSRHDRTDEGYCSLSATIYFPCEVIEAAGDAS